MFFPFYMRSDFHGSPFLSILLTIKPSRKPHGQTNMTKQNYPYLLSPARLGSLQLPNRVFMSPMTRFRVDQKGVPTPLNALYYAQRASAGLIISEYCYPHPQGRSAAKAASIYTGTGKGMANDHRWCQRKRAPHVCPVGTRRTHFSPSAATQPRCSPRPFPRSPQQKGPSGRGNRCRDLWGSTATTSHEYLQHQRSSRALCRRRQTGSRRRLPRGRTPCGQRVSAPSVSFQKHQPENRCIRWQPGRKPSPICPGNAGLKLPHFVVFKTGYSIAMSMLITPMIILFTKR